MQRDANEILRPCALCGRQSKRWPDPLRGVLKGQYQHVPPHEIEQAPEPMPAKDGTLWALARAYGYQTGELFYYDDDGQRPPDKPLAPDRRQQGFWGKRGQDYAEHPDQSARRRLARQAPSVDDDE